VGEEIRGEYRDSSVTYELFICLTFQDAQTKYRESKAELDELVATMEGL
jgi:hypothetical protein